MQRVAQCAARCGRKELAGILTIAGRAALAGGQILKELYGTPHQITHKGAIDLVTEADVAAEKAILSILEHALPGAAVLSEESHGEYQEVPAGPTWIIDPLDGTTNFAHGFPWFAVSIAYAEGGKSLAGVVYHPMLDELFCGCRDSGAWLNGEPIAVSAAKTMRSSLLATGFPYAIDEHSPRVIAALAKILPHVQGVRRAGAAALDMAYVACGRLDGFWEIMLKPWDTAAGLVLVEEAGGAVSDFAGGAYSPFLQEVLATNGMIAAELAAQLGEFSLR